MGKDREINQKQIDEPIQSIGKKDGKQQNKTEWERHRKEAEENEQIQSGSEMDGNGKPQRKTELKRKRKEAETNRRADTERK